MKHRLVIMFVIFSFLFAPTPIEAKKELGSWELMTLLNDVQLRSLIYPTEQMHIIPYGSIVRVYCMDNICLLDDLSTWILRENLMIFEWLKPTSYKI